MLWGPTPSVNCRWAWISSFFLWSRQTSSCPVSRSQPCTGENCCGQGPPGRGVP